MSVNAPTHLAIIKHSYAQYDAMVNLRRALHQHPELSGQESWTAATLKSELEKLGWEVRTQMGGHSLVADWITDPNKPTVALRVDMDALPIFEENDIPYRSQIPGVMHACGHDVHSAIGVGVAAVIASLGNAVPGNVRILFQAEEEQITGALRMIRAGALTNPKPSAIFGLHVAPFPCGTVAWTDGLFLSGFQHFLITLFPNQDWQGPKADLDEVAERCCRVIREMNLWHLPETWPEMERFCSLMQQGPPELQRFTVFDASRNSEHPDAWPGQFGVGIKAANPHLRRAALGRIKATLNTICGVAHAHYRIEPVGSMPDMRNDPELVRQTLPDLKMALSSNLLHVKTTFPFNCEDFAFYTRAVPGAMVWIGGANPEQGKLAMLHTNDFDVDEDCLLHGTRAMTTLLLSALSQAEITPP
ncbi:MAG: amidohydrolase [Anaerolineaceae bacterium]|nr:amidohydrolase [Anaerolineaceae bacterium]